MAWELVVNPKSRRLIRKAGVLHIKLIKAGLMDEYGPIEPKAQPDNKETETIIKTTDSNKCIVKYRIKKI